MLKNNFCCRYNFVYFWVTIISKMNIAKEIQDLLNYHECVILPGFGGFISNYKPASFNSQSNTFKPPYKEVVFSSKINRNDGLLINQLVVSQGVDFHQANLAVISFVDRLFISLNKGEKIAFEKLGEFEFDRNGNIIFTPGESLELTDAYGLQSFSMPLLCENAAMSVYRTKPVVRRINNRKDALKIAASVVLLLGLSLFPLKNDNLKLDTSNLNPVKIMAESVPDRIDEVKFDESVSLPGSEINKLPYVLVGGSFSSFENATTLQNRFKNQEYNSEIIKMDDGLFRVIVDSYKNKQEALNAMEKYRSSYPASGVWVSTR